MLGHPLLLILGGFFLVILGTSACFLGVSAHPIVAVALGGFMVVDGLEHLRK